jgi:hypothetical protein
MQDEDSGNMEDLLENWEDVLELPTVGRLEQETKDLTVMTAAASTRSVPVQQETEDENNDNIQQFNSAHDTRRSRQKKGNNIK